MNSQQDKVLELIDKEIGVSFSCQLSDHYLTGSCSMSLLEDTGQEKEEKQRPFHVKERNTSHKNHILGVKIQIPAINVSSFVFLS